MNSPVVVKRLASEFAREKRDEVVAKCDDRSASNAGANVQLQEKK
jgi:hypothetical protein